MENKITILEWIMEKGAKGELKILIVSREAEMEEALRTSYEVERAMLEALKANEPYKGIDLYINSRGGLASSAIGILDALRKVPRRIPIRTLIDGECSSAATFLLGVRGDIYMTPKSRIMIHKGEAVRMEDGEGEMEGESLAVKGLGELLADTYRRAMRRNLGWSEARARRNDPEVWSRTREDFTAKKALDAGLVAGIIGLDAFERHEEKAEDRKALKKYVREGLALAAVAAAVLIGLGYRDWQKKDFYRNLGKRLTEGTIVEKIYHPQGEKLKMVNKVGRDGLWTEYLPMERDECWAIRVRDGWTEDIWIISEDEWNRAEIGMRARQSMEE